ncbi:MULTISPECIES: baeRF2 domain-containing protein [Streptomycetaceae]|uniref:Peptide chain release factor 1 n=1 Tax=Streptantibioticus cattleyicolor (strain ATCC 35852 / DSM 46488 / JCM 4925 / NBRC 14057 / NRRL 8057) TaxID=1003195 RepID=F8K463_STREN|nr:MULTISPECIES: hypothetical protein [Streptomycetaceae]AEW92607.1 hypothetical protein SCATT_02360 [Streptantibioticus cattleyicolor NRRL 8057 = DSM 46488]MYS57388.1 hypothetical protein [Streptomyces sp. SID5468]CCB72962.1 conserved protein of unknown function [Streptantibioticus cattleyicolor NRRL 8057 = DSM 46488]
MELAFLKPLDRPGPWASVHLDTSRNTEDAAKQYELRVRSVGATLAEQGCDARTRGAVLDRLAAEPVSGAPPGRALFATAGQVVLDVPLVVAPPLAEVCWAPLPRTTPLLSWRGDEPPCLVAYIDHSGADLERRDGHRREPTGHAEGAAWQGRGHRSIPADRYEWHYRNKVQNQWSRTAEIIAGELAERFPRCDARMLVLVGEPGERAAVRERLPEPLRNVTVEVENGTRAPGASNPQLDEEIERARAEFARRRLSAVLDVFHAGRGRPGEHGVFGPGSSPGMAADGVPAVVDAVRRHQVGTLLLRADGPDLRRQVWIGPEPEQIGVQRSELRSMGVREPITVGADDALMRCAAATDAEALLVPAELPGPSGGIGAALRWSLTPVAA